MVGVVEKPNAMARVEKHFVIDNFFYQLIIIADENLDTLDLIEVAVAKGTT